MPPLPSTIHGGITTLIETLTRRQRDLIEFQIPRLRRYKGTLPTHEQYAAELHEDLDLFSRNVKTLETLVDEQERERDRREVAQLAQQFAQSLEQMRKDTRTALLTSKRAIDSLAQSNPDELFRSNAVSEKKYSDEKSGDALMSASSDVTEALRRTIGLMQGELERSVLSTQMLEESSASLRSTTAAHDTLSTLLGTSKHLIIALEKSDWLDRLLIFAAVAFFFLVVAFILKQRVLDKSFRIAFWWTRYLPHFHGDPSLAVAEPAETASLIATAAVTTLSTAASIGATAAKQLSVTSESTMGDASSTQPKSSVTPPGAHGIEETLRELLQSTTSHGDPSPTSNQRQETADAYHDEL